MPEVNDDPFGGPPPDEQALPTEITEQSIDPFGKAPTQDQALSSVRNSQFQELRDNPQLVGDLFSLTHQEVGTQGPEAQQAFIETVFNRAAARGQTLDQAMHDSGYYPKVSLRPAELSNAHIENYGNILSQVGQGSNISGGATGNASKNVRFAGGPQTFVAGGERFGVEGPDISKTPAPIVVASSQEVPQDEADPFGKPAPTSLPSPQPTPQRAPNWADKSEEALIQYVTGMVPKTGEEVARMAHIPTNWSDPRQVAKFVLPPVGMGDELASQAINRINQIREADLTPAGSQERYNAGIGTALDVLQFGAMIKGAAKAATVLPAVPMMGETGVRGSGKFRATYNIDKTLGDIMEGIGASKESGGLRGEIAVRNLTQGLSPEQSADLGRYLVSKRLKQVASDNPIQFEIPDDAKATVNFRTETGGRVSQEMNAREAEGIFTKEQSSLKALIDCLGG